MLHHVQFCHPSPFQGGKFGPVASAFNKSVVKTRAMQVEQAVVATVDDGAVLKYKQDNFRTLYLHQMHGSLGPSQAKGSAPVPVGSAARGYVGNWFIGVHTPTPMHKRAMRVWTWVEGQEFECTQTNVYETNMGPMLGPQTQRPADGYFTSSWQRKLDTVQEGYHHEPFVKPTHLDIPAWACRRALGLGAGAHAAAYPAVPMRLLTQEDLVPPRKDILQLPDGWSCELFVVDADGVHKWCAVIGYNMLSGKLISVANIQEHLVDIPDLDQALSFDTLPVPQPRDKLPEDPASWLPSNGGPVSGSSYGLRVEPLPGGDGRFVQVPATPNSASWDPDRISAEVAAGHARLILLPDSMYCLVPEELPGLSGRPLRLEFGGIMRKHSSGAQRCLRRSVISWGPDGVLQSAMHHTFEA